MNTTEQTITRVAAALSAARDPHDLLLALEHGIGPAISWDRLAVVLPSHGDAYARALWCDRDAGAVRRGVSHLPEADAFALPNGAACRRLDSDRSALDADEHGRGLREVIACRLDGGARDGAPARPAALRVGFRTEGDRAEATALIERLCPVVRLGVEIVLAGEDAIDRGQGLAAGAGAWTTLNRALVETERMWAMNQLVAGVAHELNNPLTGILGFAEMLLLDPHGPDRPATFERISHEGKRAAGIIRDLLKFARYRNDPKARADLNEVVEETVSLRAYVLQLSGIALSRELAPDLPATLLDVQRIQEVILNLVLNAEQAIRESGQGSSIRIVTDTVGAMVRLRVIDDGPGVSMEDLSRLFVPFYSHRREPGRGTGLGLATRYGTVRAHDGQISLERNPGGGMTATVLLPIRAPAPDHDPPDVPILKPPPTGTRILVVDDQEAVRFYLTAALRRLGHDVVSAPTAEEALERLSEEPRPFDVVILDVLVPAPGGVGLFGLLEEKRPDLARRVVLQAADVNDPGVRAVADRARAPLLGKPFTLEEIEEAIARVLAQA